MKRNQGAGAIFVFAKEAKNLWASKPNTNFGWLLKKKNYFKIKPQGIGEDHAQVKK